MFNPDVQQVQGAVAAPVHAGYRLKTQEEAVFRGEQVRASCRGGITAAAGRRRRRRGQLSRDVAAQPALL